MQVSQSEDTITHAVIGGAAAIDFKVAESNFLMQMLSSTLYQRPKEAVVRETMCNAWDSHIDSGNTETPIEVTVANNKLIVKDFGKGIPKSKIGDIYGTYGASTKQNDIKQTGGFGLGSKSPFAVSEHFQVVSCYDGEKTIYSMSKSSAEINGKPGIVPMVSVPTTEHGVIVTIDIGNFDTLVYMDLVKKIAFNGDIPCKLNGNLLDTLSFKNQSNNWIITNHELTDRVSDRIYVRYGNVIYPVEDHARYTSTYRIINNWLNRQIGGRTNREYNLVLLAKPDSLSVMPSREGLSMQEHTINSLTQLLAGFVPVMSLYSMPKAMTVLEQSMLEAFVEKNYQYMVDTQQMLPTAYKQVMHKPEIIRDIDGITERVLTVSYPADPTFIKRHKELRREYAIKLNPAYKDKLLSLFKLQDMPEFVPNKAQAKRVEKFVYSRRYHYNGPRRRVEAWYKNNLVRPLVQSIRKQPYMAVSNLYNYERYCGDRGLKNLKDYTVVKIEECFKHLRKIVVLTFSKANMDDRVGAFPIWYGIQREERDGIFIYHANDSRKHVDSIRQFFVDAGYTILDLTVPQPWDAPKPPKIGKELYGPPAPPKKRPTDYIALKHVKSGRGYRVDYAFDPNIKDPLRLDAPTCFVRIEQSKADVRSFTLSTFHGVSAQYITKWLGDVCAVVRNDTDQKKLVDAGVPDLKTYVLDRVYKTVSTEQRFLSYWSDDVNRVLGKRDGEPYPDRDMGELTYINYMFECDDVRSLFGLTNYLTPEDKIILYIWRQLQRESYCYDNDSAFKAATKIVRAQPVNDHVKHMVNDLRGNRFLGLLFQKNFDQLLVTEPAKMTQLIEAAIT